MLDAIGVGTVITKVADDSYFKDHVASGDYDLALYSWPATAYPATDGRPIFAKPEPATDGSLLVEQNYTRVGSDHIDQLFDRAVSELDANASRDLLKQADARIWAAAGSIPLYQRPQLVAVDKKLANVGAFGFAAPRYEDIGFTGGQAAGSPRIPRSSRSGVQAKLRISSIPLPAGTPGGQARSCPDPGCSPTPHPHRRVFRPPDDGVIPAEFRLNSGWRPVSRIGPGSLGRAGPYHWTSRGVSARRGVRVLETE